MWYEEKDRYVRVPVPKSFDNLVEDLQNRDSVLWESISLPSLSSTKSSPVREEVKKNEQHVFTDPVFNLSDSCSDEDEPSPAEIDRCQLLNRIKELERQNKEKDAIIANLQSEAKKLRQIANEKRRITQNASVNRDVEFYKERYEMMRAQYEKLKEALAADGKMKRVRVRSVRTVKM